MSTPTPAAARYPATDAAAKARILDDVRQEFGADAWDDDHTEIVYCMLLVLDRMGLLVVVTPSVTGGVSVTRD
jgi:hypothetical protein